MEGGKIEYYVCFMSCVTAQSLGIVSALDEIEYSPNNSCDEIDTRSAMLLHYIYTVSQKIYHPTTNDNFNSRPNYPITIILVQIIVSE